MHRPSVPLILHIIRNRAFYARQHRSGYSCVIAVWVGLDTRPDNGKWPIRGRWRRQPGVMGVRRTLSQLHFVATVFQRIVIR